MVACGLGLLCGVDAGRDLTGRFDATVGGQDRRTSFTPAPQSPTGCCTTWTVGERQSDTILPGEAVPFAQTATITCTETPCSEKACCFRKFNAPKTKPDQF